MKLRKLAALLLAVLMCMAVFTGCAGSDWKYIEKKGEMTIGITIFAPMNYYDANNNLTGFETDFATEVCRRLGVKPKFQIIDWNSKETELNSKNIDCIWNGMTVTDERRQTMDITTEYMENKQVIVTTAARASEFVEAEAFVGATVVAEEGSAGEEAALGENLFSEASYTAVDSQAKALLEVKSGTADMAVIDYVMSIGSIGEGTDYSDLVILDQYEFAPEMYGVAFRKNSPETLDKVNAVIDEMKMDGTLDEIAAKYKLDELIIKAVG